LAGDSGKTVADFGDFGTELVKSGFGKIKLTDPVEFEIALKTAPYARFFREGDVSWLEVYVKTLSTKITLPATNIAGFPGVTGLNSQGNPVINLDMDVKARIRLDLDPVSHQLKTNIKNDDIALDVVDASGTKIVINGVVFFEANAAQLQGVLPAVIRPLLQEEIDKLLSKSNQVLCLKDQGSVINKFLTQKDRTVELVLDNVEVEAPTILDMGLEPEYLHFSFSAREPAPTSPIQAILSIGFKDVTGLTPAQLPVGCQP
jgi:hypothetical protein